MAKYTGLTAHINEVKKMELLRSVMHNDFFPPSPGLEDTIMQKISAEVIDEEALLDAPGGISLRSWVIIGCFVLLSLSTAFFGMDFINVADAQGSSFLLPVGITIGVVLTGYGALFIGSHLEELSSRFRIH